MSRSVAGRGARSAWRAGVPLWLTVAALGGCAMLEPEAMGPAEDGGVEVVVPSPGEERDRDEPGDRADPLHAAPAVVELQQQAQGASAQGDHERAAALLERALRVEPQNPALWHNLAIVRFRQGDYDQAEHLAMRSLDRAQARRELQRRNWDLIAETRANRGDGEGAEVARRRAESLAAGAGP